MQIVNFLRARLLNSSYAALDLARNNSKHAEFAKNIVSIKQSSAVRDLIVSHSDPKRHSEMKYKINKYDFVLRQLSLIQNTSSVTTSVALSDGSVRLPRLKVVRINNNGHEYVVPYNNKSSELIITKIDERLI